MVRLTRDSDATEIRQYLADFGLNTTLTKIRQRRRAYITFIEPGVGYAEIKLGAAIKVSSIFPRGTNIALLKPVLAACFTEAATRVVLTIPVWARFFGGVDADGKPDGGESECRAWHRAYRNTVVVPPDTRGGLWEIRSTRGLGGLL